MTDETTENAKFTAVRDASGRFLTTSGRVPGIRNKRTKASASAISSLQDLAFKQLQTLLEAGNPSIVEFVVKSLLPTGGRAIQLDGPLDSETLLDAATSGTISPQELYRLSSAVEKLKRIDDLESVQARLEQLERLLRQGAVE